MRDLDFEVVAGSWPAAVTGEIVISAGDPATAGAYALFGDGLTIRLSLQPGTHGAPPGRFAWRVRHVESPSRRLRIRRPAEFSATPIGTMSPFGSMNIANTAPLPWGDRLFVTSDAGRPAEIDAATLGFLAEVGHRADWVEAMPHPVLPLVLSSAHPVIDPDRACMWTVNRTITGDAHMIRYDGDGAHVDRWPVSGVTFPFSNHTITQTRDWIVLADTPFVVDPGSLGGAPRRAVPPESQPVALVRKADLESTRPGEPVEARAFRLAPVCHHFYARYDDTDGVRILWEHSEGFDLADYLHADDVDPFGAPIDPALHGLFVHHFAPARVTETQFDPESGVVTERAQCFEPDALWANILSAMDWSAEGQAAPRVHHQVFGGYRPDAIARRTLERFGDRFGDRVGPLPSEELPPVLATLDRDTLKPTSAWTFATDDYPTSPAFVPRAGGTPGGTDGHVALAVHHDGGLRIELYDAADVGRGPVAVLRSPDRATVPFLLHAAWMPRATGAPEHERLRFGDEIAGRLGGLDDEQVHAVEAVARELEEL